MNSQNIYAIKYYDSLLKNENFITISGIGKSMYPLLNKKMKIKIIQKEQYDIGDLVLYSKSNRIILHRIIEINRTACRVKGDNTLSYDVIRTRQIIGCATGYSIKGRKHVVFLKNRISTHTIPLILKKIDEANLEGKKCVTTILRGVVFIVVMIYRAASIWNSVIFRESQERRI